MNGIAVRVGTTNAPANLVWQNGNNINSYNWAESSGLIPIPKDIYYKITNEDVAGNTGAFETVEVFWIPVIS
jgi:hypothetical protein